MAIPAVRANSAAPPFHPTVHVEITFDSDRTAPQSEILTEFVTRVGDELTGRLAWPIRWVALGAGCPGSRKPGAVEWGPDPLLTIGMNLDVRYPPLGAWEADPLIPTVYGWNYKPDAGPGIYRFAIVGSDAAGNAMPAPTSDADGVAVVWNPALRFLIGLRMREYLNP